MNKFLNYLKIALEIVLVILFIFFEELVWKKLALPVKEYIASLKILDGLQVKISKQTPYTTLAIFLIPLGIAEIMGIYSGMLFISGSVIAGAFLYALKIPIAGITFWIFSFTKEKLLTIDWFETLFSLLMRFIDFIKDTEIYKSVKIKIANYKLYLKSLLSGDGSLKEHINKVYEKIKDTFKELDDSEKEDVQNKSDGKNSSEKPKKKKKKKNKSAKVKKDSDTINKKEGK